MWSSLLRQNPQMTTPTTSKVLNYNLFILYLTISPPLVLVHNQPRLNSKIYSCNYLELQIKKFILEDGRFSEGQRNFQGIMMIGHNMWWKSSVLSTWRSSNNSVCSKRRLFAEVVYPWRSNGRDYDFQPLTWREMKFLETWEVKHYTLRREVIL